MGATPIVVSTGLVVATHGRHLWIEDESHCRVRCHSKGKRNEAVVGDRIDWQATGTEGRVERVHPRRSLFFRQDEIRTKSFAANIDQVLILLAAQPEFSEEQLSRALIAAEAAGVPAWIALNKRDLRVDFARSLARLEPYARMGYSVLELGLRDPEDAGWPTLRTVVDGKATLVLGPSGVGKSTLVNALVPDAGAQTGEISTALNSGKHTTTSTQWYWLNADRQSAIIDSPGFQEFGLYHVQAQDLTRLMPDIRELAPNCRFYNCTHLQEPGCAVTDSLERPASGGIGASRYRIYKSLYDMLSRSRY